MRTLTLRLLERGVRIACRDRETRTLLSASYGAFQADPEVVDLEYVTGRDPGSAGFQFCRAGLGTIVAPDDGTFLARFDEDIAVALQRLRADLYFVHAAVLQCARSAVILVGPSGGGKSTLCWALTQRGLPYLSDEFAPVDVDLLSVAPFPRALSLKHRPPGVQELPDGTLRTSRALLVPLRSVNGPVPQPLPVGTTMFVDYRRDARTPAVSAVSPGEATARIYANALNPLAHARSGLDAAGRIAESSQAFEVRVTADLEATSRLLLDVLETCA